MSTQFELGAKRRRSPFAAVILGLLAPGLGLLYCGKLRQAFVVMAAAILPWLLCAVSSDAVFKTTLVLFYFAVYAVQMLWGAIVAVRIGENYELQRFNRGLIYVLVFMLFAAYNELDSTYLNQIVPLNTRSMTSALAPDDVILLSHAAYHLGDPKIGDVVAYRHDPRSIAPFLGRIIAVPGDRVELDNGRYLIDEQPLSEPAALDAGNRLVAAAALVEMSPLELKEDEYFIAADNQAGGYDSRLCGPVPREQLIGRVDAVLLTGGTGSTGWGEKP